MKKLLFLFAILFISCGEDSNDNLTLRERLTSMTSQSDLFFEQYNEDAYHTVSFFKDGYVVKVNNSVTEDYGSNNQGYKCYTTAYYDHKIDEIVVLRDEANEFNWSSNNKIFSLSMNNGLITYKRDTGYVYMSVKKITPTQLEYHNNFLSTYSQCL